MEVGIELSPGRDQIHFSFEIHFNVQFKCFFLKFATGLFPHCYLVLDLLLIYDQWLSTYSSERNLLCVYVCVCDSQDL